MELTEEQKNGLKHDAEQLCKDLKIGFNAEGVKNAALFLDGIKMLGEIDIAIDIVPAVASYLGEAIIRNYGGEWYYDDEYDTYGIHYEDINCKYYPFRQVIKQYKNGKKDNIETMFASIKPLNDSEREKRSKKKTPPQNKK